MRFLVRAGVRLVVVLIGLWAVGQGLARWKTVGDEAADEFAIAAFVGGVQRTCRAGSLRHGSVSVVFGGVDLDLRDAVLDPAGARLEFSASLGRRQPLRSGDLEGAGRAPGGARRGRRTGHAGPEELPDDAPVLRVEATARLGGVAIKAGSRCRRRVGAIGPRPPRLGLHLGDAVIGGSRATGGRIVRGRIASCGLPDDRVVREPDGLALRRRRKERRGEHGAEQRQSREHEQRDPVPIAGEACSGPCATEPAAMVLTTARPTAPPTWRLVLSRPDAAPAWVGGTPARTAIVAGMERRGRSRCR